MRLDIAAAIASNSLIERLEDPLSIKSMLLFGAIIALCVAVGIAFSVATKKKDEKTPQNLEVFYADEILETKKLERTLSVALIAVAFIAVSMAAYYVWEATRQSKMTTSFETRSVRRGQTLYANESTPGYNSAESLSCANCHGGYDEETGRFANGGTANYTIKSKLDPATDPACKDDEKFRNPDCITVSVAWEAPALNTAMYKFPIRRADPDNPFKSACRPEEQRSTPDCRSQVYDILTYGRPGTPMPAWGVAGGGAKNEQAINDLVNFIAAIQLPSDEAAQPKRSAEIIKQKKVINEAEVAYEEAKEEAIATGTDPKKVDEQDSVKAAKATLTEAKAALKAIEAKTEMDYIREAALVEAQAAVDTAQKRVSEEAPAGLAAAQADFNAAQAAYEAESALDAYPNPQAYLDEIATNQTDIKLEKKVEDAKESGNKKAEARADAQLVELLRLRNIAQNFLETRDAVARAQATVDIFAPQALANSQARLAQVQGANDGQLLFEANCARCHTKGWSYFTPEDARVPLPSPQGTGAFGPSLAGGNVTRQFPLAIDQITFINSGSAFQAPYGERGIGSGRMPGYNTVAGRILTDEQIAAIVEYERTALVNPPTELTTDQD
jgi:mono/diheme cytochrome c family protein